MPSISDTLLLPGQPIPLPPRAPAPQLGPGIYERNGQVRASLLGIPQFDGSVRRLFPYSLTLLLTFTFDS